MRNLRNVLVYCLSAIVGFTMIACAVAHAATDEVEATDSSMSGAKAIFESGAGPSFMAHQEPKKTSVGSINKLSSSKKQSREKYMGVAYWIELLTPEGKHVLANKNRSFRSGERFKLNIKPNRNGYLYVVNIGSTGKTRVLFPASKENNNYILANQTYSVPSNAYMMFDDNPGDETLLVMVSPRSMSDVFLSSSSPSIETDQSRPVLAYAEIHGTKDIIVENRDQKDIVLEPNMIQQTHYDRYTSGVSSYVVAPVSSLERNGGVISIVVKLNHR